MAEWQVAQTSPFQTSLLQRSKYTLTIRVVKASLYASGLSTPEKAAYAVTYRAKDRSNTKAKALGTPGTWDPVFNASFRFYNCGFDEAFRLEIKAPHTGRNYVFGGLEFSIRDVLATPSGGTIPRKFRLTEDGRSSAVLVFSMDPPLGVDSRLLPRHEMPASEPILLARSRANSETDRSLSPSVNSVSVLSSPTVSRKPSVTDDSYSGTASEYPGVWMDSSVRDPAYMAPEAGLCSVLMDCDLSWWLDVEEAHQLDRRHVRKKSHHSRNNTVISPRASDIPEELVPAQRKRISSSNFRTKKIVSMSMRHMERDRLLGYGNNDSGEMHNDADAVDAPDAESDADADVDADEDADADEHEDAGADEDADADEHEDAGADIDDITERALNDGSDLHEAEDTDEGADTHDSSSLSVRSARANTTVPLAFEINRVSDGTHASHLVSERHVF